MVYKRIAYAFLPAVLGVGLLSANIASAHGLFGGFYVGSDPKKAPAKYAEMFQHKAQILGISDDEVKAAWADGKTMKEIMTEKGIKREDAQARAKTLAQEQMIAHLNALVDAGVITRAQADTRLSVLNKRMDAVETKTKNGKPAGMDMRFFMHGGLFQ